MEKFCDIKSRNDLADFLHIPRKKLTYILYVEKPDNYYYMFTIPKRNGKERLICAPTGDLKQLQERISSALWTYQKSVWEEQGIKPNISHAFEKEKSIVTNAKIHRNKRFVLNLDLKDFFDSFHFGRVQGFFQKNKNYRLPYDVAVCLAQLLCFHGHLPQGAPSSPIVTNLICQVLDMRILKVAKKYKLDYTRYADDLTFSTNDKYFLENKDAFLSEVKTVITNAGFIINEKKTRLQFKDSRQVVTGLVVNEKLNVNREYIRETRAMAHRLYTTGEFLVDGGKGSLRQLEGRFSFIDQLDLYNNALDSRGIRHGEHYLNGREQQYRKFMFYRYFFANEKPLIVTEGKTDVRYLKAALKNLYLRYPRLIQKETDGKFCFKVSFFKRSKRWKYFFGISADGADTMKNLYRYHVGDGKTLAYLEYFRRMSGQEQLSPVILLFDNETKGNKPLKKFLGDSVHATTKQNEELQEQLYIRLVPNSKLFLVTTPLIGEKEECEMEMLFAPELLAKTMGGKTFCLKDKFDNTKHYGKEIFSKYVYENYENIDFSNFIPLLDAVDAVIQQSENQSS